MILLISKKICLDFILLFETSSRHLSLSCLSIYLSAICLYYVCVYVCIIHLPIIHVCMYTCMYVVFAVLLLQPVVLSLFLGVGYRVEKTQRQ